MAVDSGNFAVDEIIKFGEGVVSFYDFVFYFVEVLIYSIKSFINILETIVDDIKPEINVIKVFFEYHIILCSVTKPSNLFFIRLDRFLIDTAKSSIVIFFFIAFLF